MKIFRPSPLVLSIIISLCLYSCASASETPSNTSMSCPAVQFGQKGRNITCVTSVNASSISMSMNDKALFECNATSCSGYKGYTGLVTTNDTHLVVSMTIEKVEAHDESTLTCGVEVNEELDQENATCLLFLYVPPEKPLCNYTFNESHALVTCSTAKVYPPAKCVWTAFSEPKVKFSTNSYIESFLGGTIHLYNTTCTANFPITNRTEYQLNVSLYPVDLKGQDMSRGAAVETQDIFIIVETPADAPVLDVTPKQREYAESDNVTISCSVLGGRPPVYSTSLNCDSEYVDTTSNTSNSTVQGQFVRMNVQLTGNMHKRSCTCSGSHVYPNYHSENTLTFEELQSMNSSQAESGLTKYSLSIKKSDGDLPVCPNDLLVNHTAQDVVTLSWTSSNPFGLQLIYTIIHNVETEPPSNVDRKQVGEVNVTRERFVEYNITLSKLSPYIVGNNVSSLSKWNRYVFSLDVKNMIGEKECPQVRLNVATEAEKSSIKGANPGDNKSLLFIIVFSVSIVLLLLPAIIIVIIKINRMKRRGGYKTVTLPKNKNSETICNSEIYSLSSGGRDTSAGTGDMVIVGPKFHIDFEIFKLRPRINDQKDEDSSGNHNTAGELNGDVSKRLTARKCSGEGSAYFNVEINPMSRNPEIKEKSEAKELGRVEYLTLSKSCVNDGEDGKEATYTNRTL